MEALRLPDELEAKANPKSTTGRLDVFTRLITDYGAEFEFVPKGYVGRSTRRSCRGPSRWSCTRA